MKKSRQERSGRNILFKMKIILDTNLSVQNKTKLVMILSPETEAEKFQLINLKQIMNLRGADADFFNNDTIKSGSIQFGVDNIYQKYD